MTNIRNLFIAIRLYMPGIFFVSFIYFLFIGIDQGIDVVVQTGEFFWHGVLGCTGVVIWSFLTWYALRVLSYAHQSAFGNEETRLLPTSFHQTLPRLISYHCIVSVQTAILNIMLFKGNMLAIAGFILVQSFLFFLLSSWFKGKGNKIIMGGAITLSLLYVAGLLAGLWVNRVYATPGNFQRYQFWLLVIAMSLFVIQVLAVWLFIKRRKLIDEQLEEGEEKHVTFTMKRLKLNDKFKPAESKYFNIFHLLSSATTIIYLTAIFSMDMAIAMGPLSFAVIAIGVLTGFFSIVKYASIRTRFSIGVVILLLAIVVGKVVDPYEVRLTPSTQENQFAQRPDLKTYLHNWIQLREEQLDNSRDKEYKVFIVLSNGGASRAGNWVCSVLSKLQDSSLNIPGKYAFSDHVLFMAGASGGTVGNCAFYALLKEDLTQPLSSFSRHAQQYFAGDFLTFTLGRMLGPDFFRHFVPLRFIDDRAASLANVLANGSADPVINYQMNCNISEVFDYSGHLPVLIINTTRVDDGMPGVISTIQLPKHSQRIDVLNLLDSMSLTQSRLGDMTLSTASVLSARFPYVSPAGSILNNYFVDGGYFDNSGAGIILEYAQELETLLSDTTDAYLQRYGKKLAFYVLHLTNSPKSQTEPERISPLVNDLFTPLLTLGGMQGSSTKIGNGMLKNYFVNLNKNADSSLYEFSLYKDDEEEEAYPMSWVISQYQLQRMKDRCAQEVHDKFHLVE